MVAKKTREGTDFPRGVRRRLAAMVDSDVVYKGVANSIRLLDEKGREFNVSVFVDDRGTVYFPGDRDWMGLQLRAAVEAGEFGVHLDRVEREMKEAVRLRVMVALFG